MRESSDSRLALPATTSQDVMTDILRAGAQQLLAQAVEAEVAAWIEPHASICQCRRSSAGGSQWPVAQADDPDGGRLGRSRAATSARSTWC